MGATACSGCNSSPSPTAEASAVWVPESPWRGALSLITACVFTIFLYTRVIIYSRVYKNPLLGRLLKAALLLKTAIAPELIAVEALHEWS
jgi:hypothetical protein